MVTGLFLLWITELICPGVMHIWIWISISVWTKISLLEDAVASQQILGKAKGDSWYSTSSGARVSGREYLGKTHHKETARTFWFHWVLTSLSSPESSNRLWKHVLSCAIFSLGNSHKVAPVFIKHCNIWLIPFNPLLGCVAINMQAMTRQFSTNSILLS